MTSIREDLHYSGNSFIHKIALVSKIYKNEKIFRNFLSKFKPPVNQKVNMLGLTLRLFNIQDVPL